MPNEVPLAVLWERAAAGDGAAFTVFYQRHGDAVYRHCRTRVNSQADAEDITLAVFEVAWRRRATLRLKSDGDILPSLLAIANLLLKRHYAAVFRRTLLMRRIGPPGQTPDPADEVAESVTHEKDVRRAMAAVDRLRRSDRELIQMCLVERLSAEQAAAILGAKPGTIRTRLSRALARARREYFRMAHERPDEGGPVAVTT